MSTSTPTVNQITCPDCNGDRIVTTTWPSGGVRYAYCRRCVEGAGEARTRWLLACYDAGEAARELVRAQERMDEAERALDEATAACRLAVSGVES